MEEHMIHVIKWLINPLGLKVNNIFPTPALRHNQSDI